MKVVWWSLWIFTVLRSTDAGTVILVGYSGKGKSEVANCLVSDGQLHSKTFKTCRAMGPCTQVSAEHSTRDQSMSIVDTVGFGDYDQSDGQILATIAKHARKGDLTALVYVFTERLTAVDIKLLSLILNTTFPGIHENTVLLRNKEIEFEDQRLMAEDYALLKDLPYGNVKLEFLLGEAKFLSVNTNPKDAASYRKSFELLNRTLSAMSSFNPSPTTRILLYIYSFLNDVEFINIALKMASAGFAVVGAAVAILYNSLKATCVAYQVVDAGTCTLVLELFFAAIAVPGVAAPICAGMTTLCVTFGFALVV